MRYCSSSSIRSTCMNAKILAPYYSIIYTVYLLFTAVQGNRASGLVALAI